MRETEKKKRDRETMGRSMIEKERVGEMGMRERGGGVVQWDPLGNRER